MASKLIWLIPAVVIGGLLGFTQAFSEPLGTKDCLLCHQNKPLKSLENSVHSKLSCVVCHRGAKGFPHEDPIDPKACDGCHPKIAGAYWEGIHGRGLQSGIPDVPSCSDCHGSHEILPIEDPNSWVFPFNLPRTCGRCHGNAKLAADHEIPVPQAYQEYLESVHGRGLLQSGLLFAATCTDCHGAHAIHPNADPRSKLHPSRLPETCGRCHLGVLTEYEESVHVKPSGVETKNPVCTDCHLTHALQPPQGEAFKLASVLACAECHPESFETYRESYHGQVTALGYAGVATCSDCHGNHKILPPQEPESTLSPGRIISTCGKCHPYANANFVQFLPHVRPSDPKAAPPALYGAWLFMTVLLFGVFSVFGTHTLLWAVRGYLVPVISSLMGRLRRGRGRVGGEALESSDEECDDGA